MTTTDALADDLARLAKACREAGEVGLKRELTDAINKAAEPVPDAIRASLKPHLPDRYAEVLDADLKITVSIRTGAGAGVTIQATAPTGRGRRGRALPAINAGILRHPVFAQGPRRSWHWKDQELPSVQPDFFSQPVHDAAPQVRKEIENALDGLNAKIWAATHG